MPSTTLNRPIEVLLLENTPGQIRIAHAIVKDVDADIWIRVNVVTDREQARAFLRREGRWSDAPRPDLVLLDVDPDKSCPASAEVCGDPYLKDVPRIDLSGPRRRCNSRFSCELSQQCHLCATPSATECQAVILAVKDVWLRLTQTD